MPETTAASRSALARSRIADMAISRPSEETAIASTTPGGAGGERVQQPVERLRLGAESRAPGSCLVDVVVQEVAGHRDVPSSCVVCADLTQRAGHARLELLDQVPDLGPGSAGGRARGSAGADRSVPTSRRRGRRPVPGGSGPSAPVPDTCTGRRRWRRWLVGRRGWLAAGRCGGAGRLVTEAVADHRRQPGGGPPALGMVTVGMLTPGYPLAQRPVESASSSGAGLGSDRSLGRDETRSTAGRLQRPVGPLERPSLRGRGGDRQRRGASARATDAGSAATSPGQLRGPAALARPAWRIRLAVELHCGGDPAAGGGAAARPPAVPPGQPADHEQAEHLGRREVEPLAPGEPGVLLGQPLLGHADAVVDDREPGTAGGSPAATTVTRVCGGENVVAFSISSASISTRSLTTAGATEQLGRDLARRPAV